MVCNIVQSETADIASFRCLVKICVEHTALCRQSSRSQLQSVGRHTVHQLWSQPPANCTERQLRLRFVAHFVTEVLKFKIFNLYLLVYLFTITFTIILHFVDISYLLDF